MCLPCDVRYYPAVGPPGPYTASHLRSISEEHTMTDTATITPEQRLTVVKHLAGGKGPDVVATITGLSRGVVIDIGSHHGYPDKEKLSWAADILAKKIADGDAPREDPRREERARAGTPVTPTARPTSAPAAPVTPLTRPDEIRILLNTAKGHPSKRIQAAADRIFDQVGRLRELIREDDEKNAEKRRAAAAKEAARAEVKRLEQQLADARAKLRGTKPPATTSPSRPAGTTGQPSTSFVTAEDLERIGLTSKELRAWAGDHNIECSASGRVPRRVLAAYDDAHAPEVAAS